MTSVAVVTGASRGIGRETAINLASDGCQVLALARSKEKLNSLAAHLPDSITPYPIDLTQSEQIAEFADFVDQNFQEGIDILINNAGSLISKSFLELTDDDWNTMWQMNVMTAVKITRGLAGQMKNPSHILNISSMGGYQGAKKFPPITAYSVAKGGLSILTECLVEIFRGQNIKCNALCIGAVQTEMLEQAFPGMEAPLTARQMGSYIADFAQNGHTFYNGKVLPVALEDPE
mgnify:CR=1 FL=1